MFGVSFSDLDFPSTVDDSFATVPLFFALVVKSNPLSHLKHRNCHYGWNIWDFWTYCHFCYQCIDKRVLYQQLYFGFYFSCLNLDLGISWVRCVFFYGFAGACVVRGKEPDKFYFYLFNLSTPGKNNFCLGSTVCRIKNITFYGFCWFK